MAEPAKQYDLFISYADADCAWVEGYLLDCLKQAGLTYLTEAAFSLGSVRLLEFERAIQRSRRTLLVISSAYLADGVNQFISLLSQTYGLETQTWPVIPLILQAVTLPLGLRALVPLKATDSDEWADAIERLCTDLKGTVPAPVPPPECPYPGMVPFGVEDSERFFGRDRETEELIERLRLNPFITVIGPSGSGKSSLVFAGLIPALRRSRLFGTGEWRIQVMRPGETPQTTLNRALPGNAMPQSPTQRLLLIVDQFEELFTLAGAEAVPFQESLLQLTKTPNIYLVLTVRADFYPDLMTSLLWQKIQNHRLEVVPLNEEGLRQAILKPADSVGVFVEAALLERLVVDAAGEPGVLPLIQETLVLLWERIERRFLPLRAYEALVLTRSAYGGQESGQRTGLQVAIARRADAALAALEDDPEKQQAVARRIFLRLIQFGEGRSDTRRQQSVDALRTIGDEPQLFEQTLTHLVNCRLLTLTGDAQGTATRKVDISHEALITGWPTLQQWIVERREAEQTRRRLTAKAEEWIRLGRGAGGLLDRVELAEAQRWLESPDAINLGFDESLVAFTTESQATVEKAEREKAQQQERELKLARDSLEQKEKALKLERNRNRLAIASLIVMTGLTTLAFFLWGIARKQSLTAQLEALSSSSEAMLASHQEFDALVEALRAARKLENSTDVNSGTRLMVTSTLQQSIYKVRERNRLQRHRLAVNSVSFGSNGLLASASDDKTIKLWNIDGSLRKEITGHQDVINWVSFSHNGQLIASASSDQTVKVWTVDGNLQFTLKGYGDAVRSVSFNRSDTLIASASDDGMIKLWQVNGQPYKAWQAHNEPINQVSFSTDGTLIASVSDDGMIKLWQVNGQPYKAWQAHNDVVKAVNFSQDGKTLLTTSNDRTVKLWSLQGQLLGTLQGHEANVNSAAFSPDGKEIVTASDDKTVRLWNLDGKTLRIFHGHTDFVKSVSFSLDGQIIASASSDNTIRLWSRISREPKTYIQAGLSKGNVILTQVESAAISRDSKLIATASDDKKIKLWTIDGKLINSFIGHPKPVLGMSFSPDGRLLATASSDKTAKLWNLNGKLLSALSGHQSIVTHVSFSPDTNTIATASHDHTIKIWDRNGKLKHTLVGHTNSVAHIDFSPDGQFLASASWDYTVKLWKVDGSLLQTLSGHTDAVESVTFSPNSQLIISTSRDGTVKLWNMKGKLLKSYHGHNGWTTTARFSPDGKLVAVSGDDGNIRIWDITQGKSKLLANHTGTIYDLQYTLDRNVLTSFGADNYITRWDFNLKTLLHTSCVWVKDYLSTNSNVDREDANLCSVE